VWVSHIALPKQGDAVGQREFIHTICGIAARMPAAEAISLEVCGEAVCNTSLPSCVQPQQCSEAL
jgi:hypothetical protein